MKDLVCDRDAGLQFFPYCKEVIMILPGEDGGSKAIAALA
jgi:hypothetical protein